MSETQIAFLYKAASSLQRVENNNTLTLLRSHYLMRCKEVTKGYGLPEKHFSPKVRCAKCCLEWKKGTETKVKAIKLSKKQRRRLRTLQASKDNKELIKNKLELLNSNEIEQICTVCKNSTKTLAPKPEKFKNIMGKNDLVVRKNVTKGMLDNDGNKSIEVLPNPTIISKKPREIQKSKTLQQKKKEINVYSNSTEVFLLNNKKNNLSSVEKEEKKVIKNNKKKKDKFAGLCQKAVLATAKLKEEKGKQNKLNLFLRPST